MSACFFAWLPSLDLPLGHEGLFPRLEFLHVYEHHWPPRLRVAREPAGVMLIQPAFEVIGMAEVETAIGAAEHLHPEHHAPP